MAENNLVDKIADKNVNINEFVKTVLVDTGTREEVVKQLLTNSNIMVYYHCYYIISNASEEKPELFYKYWDDFASLISHKNSYHRDIGLTIIANLTKVDEKNLFSSIFEKYINHFNDEKFMTAQCFVKNLKKIVRYSNEYVEQIVNLLLNIEKICIYPEKQKELLKSDIIDVLDIVYGKSIYEGSIVDFIRFQANSISPKTRKKVKDFLKKHGL